MTDARFRFMMTNIQRAKATLALLEDSIIELDKKGDLLARNPEFILPRMHQYTQDIHDNLMDNVYSQAVAELQECANAQCE